MWGGGPLDGGTTGIIPDSKAKSWAQRREALTHQYVSRLAAEAQQTGQAALNSNGDESKDESRKSGAASVYPKNLSNLSAKGIEVLFYWSRPRLLLVFLLLLFASHSVTGLVCR